MTAHYSTKHLELGDIEDDGILSLYQWRREENSIVFSKPLSNGTLEELREDVSRFTKREGCSSSAFILAPQNAESFPSLKQAVDLAGKHLKSHFEDFFLYDIHKQYRYREGIWGIRPSGTVFIEVNLDTSRSEEKKKELLEIFSYYEKDGRSKWHYWTQQTVKSVTVEKASALVHHALS